MLEPELKHWVRALSEITARQVRRWIQYQDSNREDSNREEHSAVEAPRRRWVGFRESCLECVKPETPPDRVIRRELAGQRLSRSSVFLSRLQPAN